MKEGDKRKEIEFLTRSELIKRSRSCHSLDKLPEETSDMFDNLPQFEKGARRFIDFSEEDSS